MGQGTSTQLTLSFYTSELEEKVIPEDYNEFWSQLYTVPLNHQEIYTFFTPERLAAIHRKQPQNVTNLVRVLLLQIQGYITAVRPLAYIPTVRQPNKLRSDDQRKLSNCIVILTRVLNYLMELNATSSGEQTVNSLLWVPSTPIKLTAGNISDAFHAVTGNDDSSVTNTNVSTGTAYNLTNSTSKYPITPTSNVVMASENKKPTTSAAEQLKTNGTKAENGTDSEEKTSDNPIVTTAQHPTTAEEDTLGHYIINLLMECLFLESYTIDNHHRKQRLYGGVFIHRQWEHCVIPVDSFFPSNTVGWSPYDNNRAVVIRALLVAASAGIYIEPSEYKHEHNMFLAAMVRETSVLAPTLFYSLISTVLSWNPNSQVLAYTHNLGSAWDNRERLIDLSLQLLLVLLDFRNLNKLSSTNVDTVDQNISQLPDNQQQQQVTTAQQPYNPALSSSLPEVDNIFRRLMFTITDVRILVSIYRQLTNLLQNHLVADNTWMGGSQKKIESYQEITCLVWKLIDEHPTFMQLILYGADNIALQPGVEAPVLTLKEHNETAADILELIHPLMYVLSRCRYDQSKMGLMYTCVFILLKLSGEREFGVALNTVINSFVKQSRIPALPLNLMLKRTEKLPSDANYADLLVIICHGLITQSPTHLDALLKVVLTLLANISPYITSLTLTAAVKLLELFEIFSSPSFVSQNPQHAQYVILLIDVFNNIVQYQYQGHTNLVFSIIRRAKLFWALGRLSTDNENGTASQQPQQAQRDGTSSVNSSSNQQPSSPSQPSTTGAAVSQSLHDETVESTSTDKADAFVSGSAGTDESGVESKVKSSPPAEPSNPPPASALSQLHIAQHPPASANDIIYPASTDEWRRQLPLEPIYRLLDFFVPRVDAMFKRNPKLDESGVLDMIRKTTLVGVLPVPHSLLVRRYIPNAYTALWFTTFLWGIVFLRNSRPMPLFSSNVKMFQITGPNTGDSLPPSQPASAEVSQATTPTASSQPSSLMVPVPAPAVAAPSDNSTPTAATAANSTSQTMAATAGMSSQ